MRGEGNLNDRGLAGSRYKCLCCVLLGRSILLHQVQYVYRYLHDVVVLVCRIEFLRTLSLMQSEFHSEAFSKWTRYCHSTVLRAESTVRTFPFLLAFHFPGFSICGFTYATLIPQDNLAIFLICSFKNSITTQDQTLTINQKCQILNLTSNTDASSCQV